MPTLMIPDGLGNLRPYAKGIGANLYGSSSSYAGLKSPATGPGVVWTLPAADASGYMKSDGSGILSLVTSIPASVVGLGSVENTALSTWPGSTNITTLGTIATGSIPYSKLTGTPTIPAVANSSASIGLSRVNGSSGNFMDAGSAPPLDQSIAPTMTGAWTFSPSAGTGVTILSSAAASIVQINKGTTSQSGDLFECQNSSATVRFSVGSGGDVTTLGRVTCKDEVNTDGNYFFGSGGNLGLLKAQSSGVFTLYDANTTSFGRLTLGGTTSSFPAIKRSSATVAFRLADDSADCAITAGGITSTFGTGILASGGGSNGIFVGGTSTGNCAWMADTEIRIRSSNALGFSSGSAGTALDSAFSRISAGLIGVGTGAAGSVAGSLSLTSITHADAGNIILGTATGTKIGTATNQKIGFFNAAPVVQQTLAAAASDAGTTQTLANSLRTALINLGLGA